MRSFTFGIVLFVLLILMIFGFIVNKRITYFRITDNLDYNSDSLLPTTMVLRILRENNIQVSRSFNNATYLMFETYGNIDLILKHIMYPTAVKYVAAIHGSDLLAGKDRLAKYMKNTRWIPETYILYRKQDVQKFKQRFNPNQVYIAKKNIQRQSGLLLFNDLKVFDDIKAEYVVVQKMLQNPLLIDDRKINIRVYMLVHIFQDAVINIDMYTYLGFVYYTPNKFVENSLNQNECITTGYIDRQIYVSSPLTVQDLEQVIGPDNYTKMINETHKMFVDIYRIYSSVLLTNHSEGLGSSSKSSNPAHFSIFGCDVAIDNLFGVNLIEINKGPSLDPHDARDDALKYHMVQGAHSIVGITKNRKHSHEWVKLNIQ